MNGGSVELTDFLNLSGTIIDVRSPGEFFHGHMPGAINLPLFTDAERAVVGTIYKQTGREAAVEQGLELAAPKLCEFVQQAKHFVGKGLAKIHCWRGGMRSSSMAWLLQTAGLKTVTLSGGYKAFRKWTLNSFAIKRQIVLVGGLTGSGKTDILKALKRNGEQVLDLESLANHRGSSYGMLGLPSQPSCEQFENAIALQWASFDSNRPIWIEDESRLIGSCKIPDAIFLQMRLAPLIVIEKPISERIQQLMLDYGKSNTADLIQATERIAKKLGSKRTKEVISQIKSGYLEKAMEIVLEYYDSAYLERLSERQQPVSKIYKESFSCEDWAKMLYKKEMTGEK